jgi:hypothetical protein
MINLFGKLTITMLIALTDDGKTKRVTLLSRFCELSECKDIFEQFKALNPKLANKGLYADFVNTQSID